MVCECRTRQPQYWVGVYGTSDATGAAGDGERLAGNSQMKRDPSRFAINGRVFRCVWDSEAQHYVWASECGRFTAGRNTGAAHFWSRVGDRLVERQASSLRVAMLHATMAKDEAA
mgnify:CR=1 FL=1